MRLLALTLLMMLILSGLAAPHPAAAQPPPPPVTTLYLDFDSQDDIEHELQRGVIGSGGHTGNGIRSNGGSAISPVGQTGYSAPVHIILEAPSWCTVDALRWQEYSLRSNSASFNRIFAEIRTRNANGDVHWFVTGATFGTGGVYAGNAITPNAAPFNSGGPFGPGGQIEIFMGGSNEPDDIRLDNFEMDCLGAPRLIRPFSQADEYVPTAPLTDPALTDYAGFWDCNPGNLELLPFPSCLTVAAQSLRANAPVLAAGDGVVVSVVPFTDREACKTNEVRLLFDDKTCVYFLPNPDPSQAWDVWVTEGLDNAAFVTLELDTGDIITYLVNDANRYVHVGLRVEAGCILGKAMPRAAAAERLKGSAVALLALFGGFPGVIAGFILPDNPYSAGVIFMWRIQDGLIPGGQRLVEDLTDYAEASQGCNTDPLYAACLTGNPQFVNGGDGWSSLGNVIWNPIQGVGVTMTPQSSISQTLALNTSTEYTVTFDVIGTLGQESRAILQLGSLTQEVPIGVLNTVILQGVPEADFGTLYTLSLTNIGPGDFYVQGICVVEGDQVQPPTCGATNPTFEFGLTGWTGSNSSVQWRTGAAYIPKDQTLWQEVTLPAGTYTVEIDARVALDFLVYTGGGAITLNVYYPGGSAALDLVPNYNLPGQPGYPNTPQKLTTSFTLASGVTGQLRFEPVLPEANSTILGVNLDRVCLSAGGGGGGGGGGPIAETCDRASMPTNSDVGAWTAWHWHNLNRFYTCTLMTFLNQQYKFFQETARTILLTTRWFMSSITYSAGWFGSDLIPWMNGHFGNIAVGQVTNITQTGNAGFWDFLIAIVNQVLGPIVQALQQIVTALLGIVGQGAELLFLIIRTLFGLGLQVIALLISTFLIGQDALITVISAFNAVPLAPLDNLPQCGFNPQSHPFCVALWILENTIFSGPGALIIPLLVAIGALHLLIWVVAEYQRLIRRIGQLS